jgi:hypothetical protein
MSDTFLQACGAYLRSYRKRVGTFASKEAEDLAGYCALGARSELLNRGKPPVKVLRDKLVADFAKLPIYGSRPAA